MPDPIENHINAVLSQYEQEVGVELDEETAQNLGELLDDHHEQTGSFDLGEALADYNQREEYEDDFDDSEVYSDEPQAIELYSEPDDEQEFEAAVQLVEGRLGREITDVEAQAMWEFTPEGTDRDGYVSAASDLPSSRDIARDPQLRQEIVADHVADHLEQEEEEAYERGEEPEQQYQPDPDSTAGQLAQEMVNLAEEQE